MGMWLDYVVVLEPHHISQDEKLGGEEKGLTGGDLVQVGL